MGYSSFFQKVTGFAPYPWQERFLSWDGEAVAAVSAPTGAGKEAGATVPWLYSYTIQAPFTTRLAYALPTRSLVSQVYINTCNVVNRSGLPIKVYCLKGGLLEHGFEQDLTQPAILIGTQDQLLSRALNRGFGVSWGQRPLHCAALNNDCRWVLDEIQLTGVGYTTLIQLYKLWRELGTYGKTQLCLMSATFDDRPLQGLEVERFGLVESDLTSEDRDLGLPSAVLTAKVTRPKPVFRTPVTDLGDVANRVREAHRAGTLSLVVLNTVGRARELGALLADLDPLVIHSRFLGFDRERLQERIYEYQGILIATQVVEAGVDLDADLLVTELCPWSSFVQRCGRCGRKRVDNSVKILWLDYQKNRNDLPYNSGECEAARQRLLELEDASLYTLSQFSPLNSPIKEYNLKAKEMRTFFCTHHKRRDNSYTISEYVRDPEAFTVSVVWSHERPKRIPHQRFVCPVPAQELVRFCQAYQISTQVWGNDEWVIREPAAGDIVWLPLDAGGYSHERGWTEDPHDLPIPYSLEVEPEYNDPPFAFALGLGLHLKDTEEAMQARIPYLQSLGISEELITELCRCARWHDWGKAHPVWQAYVRAQGDLLAKSRRYGDPRDMKGYRHELASAFAAAAQGVPFLAQYLIAAHHGKVRETLWPANPDERFDPKVLRGVELGTQLPEVEIEGVERLSPVTLSFTGKVLIWEKQVKVLLECYGPFRLIYLEALIRNADITASHYREQEAQYADGSDN